MATQTLPRPDVESETGAPMKRLFTTRKEYHAMEKAGILGHEEQVELLEGEIIVMVPRGIRHMTQVDRLTHIFLPLGTQKRAIIRARNPSVMTQISEFQPDITLLAFRDDFHKPNNPCPQDILLVGEISDSSPNPKLR